MQDKIRHPERQLEVIWQRHIPQGVGDATTLDGETIRVDAVTDLLLDLEQDLDRVGAYGELLDRGDLVLTLSIRPLA
jgi:hypothetical protein